jgi:hypothetical protein
MPRGRTCYCFLAIVGMVGCLLYLELQLGTRAKYQNRTAAEWEEELEKWDRIGRPGRYIWYRRPDAIPALWSRVTGRVSWGEISEKCPLVGDNDAEAVPVLVELLRSDNPKIRSLALRGLARHKQLSGATISAILVTLKDPDNDVRTRTIFIKRYVDCEYLLHCCPPRAWHLTTRP